MKELKDDIIVKMAEAIYDGNPSLYVHCIYSPSKKPQCPRLCNGYQKIACIIEKFTKLTKLDRRKK